MPDVHLPLPFEPYGGEEPYVFASYAHRDGAAVYSELRALHGQGLRIWYDEGIEPGSEWPENIGRALQGSSFFLVFMTRAAVESRNVRNEIDFALRRGKPFLAIYLEDVQLPPGLELQMGNIQAIMKWRMAREHYAKKIAGAFPRSVFVPEREPSSPDTVDTARRPDGERASRFPRRKWLLYGGSAAVGLVAAGLSVFSIRQSPKSVPPPALTAPSVGEVKTNPKDGQAYVWIPPGKFMMGCSPGDRECSENEKPAHHVEISKGFWLAEMPVTVGAWKRYAAALGESMPPEPKFDERALNANWSDDRQPMVNITWSEASDYCRQAGGRLPTEGEWEYAARAGSTESRHGPLDAIAWDADNSGKAPIDSADILKTDDKNYARRLNANGNVPHGVAQKDANAWKLYDMLGNVYQWTANWYHENYYKQNDSKDPQGPPGGQFRTVRGGSWVSDPRLLRVSCRMPVDPSIRRSDIGVRCAWE